MVLSFLKDRNLQVAAIVITEISAPVECEYANDLKIMAQGPLAQGVWAAERAAASHHWWSTVAKILQAPSDIKLLKRLRFNLRCPDAEAFSCERNEQAVAELLTTFAHELACRYAWSNAPFMITLPHCFAVMLLEDRDRRAAALDYIRGPLEAVHKAEQHWKECLANDTEQAAVLEGIFMRIGWCHHQLAREVLAHLPQSNFSADDTKGRLLAAKLYRGTSTTKNVLEDCFAHLQGMAARKMSHWSRFFYATTARCVRSGGGDHTT